MKCILLVILFFINCLQTNAQSYVKDSLLNNLSQTKPDSVKAEALWQLSEYYILVQPDTALLLAQQSLQLSKKIFYQEGASHALAMLGSAYSFKGNYSKALEIFFEKLQLEEKRNTPENYISALLNIANTYVVLKDYKNALVYYYKASLVDSINNFAQSKFNLLAGFGEAFYRMNEFDSASSYYHQAMIIANQKNDSSFKCYSFVGLGNVYLKQNFYRLSFENYKLALVFLSNNDDLFCEASIGMAKIFEQLNQLDSAHQYALKSFLIAKKDGLISQEYEAANFLWQYFPKIKKNDSAFVYLKETMMLKDSLMGQDKVREAEVMSLNEKLRQKEIEIQKQKDKDERRQQLQLLLIGIFIPLFFLCTIFLSRKKVHSVVIKFLGVISLLLFFEYLTLLLHPFIENLTHHTPIIELLIFVAVASIIIPLHHRLEFWLIKLLTRYHLPHLEGGIKIKIKNIKNKNSAS